MSIKKTNVNYNDALEVKSISSSLSAGFTGVTSFAGQARLLGTLNLSKGTVFFADGIQSKQAMPSLTNIYTKYFNYTLSSLDERDSLIQMNSTIANVLTVPSDSKTNFPVGTTIDILQANTGQTIIFSEDDVQIDFTPGFSLRQQWSTATLLKRAPNTWLLYGDLVLADVPVAAFFNFETPPATPPPATPPPATPPPATPPPATPPPATPPPPTNSGRRCSSAQAAQGQLCSSTSECLPTGIGAGSGCCCW